MKQVPLYKLFEINYGNSLDLNVLETCEDEYVDKVNFVSRTRENNGVSAIVKRMPDVEPFEAGLITVAGSGNSVLESFIQIAPFYTGYHVFILKPKIEMSQLEQLFYCYCIRQNQYKYNFGRQANKTLKDILVPEKMPSEFGNISISNVVTISSNEILNNNYTLNQDEWEYFDLEFLFKIKGSKTTPVLDLEQYGKGQYPYVTTQATNNGIDGFYNYYTEPGNVLTIDSAVLGYCSYQPLPFSASDHVEVLTPKFEMNMYIALFLVTILNKEQYRYNYGRKASQTRLKGAKVKLPATNMKKPDWDFMESYIKSLPYSKTLLTAIRTPQLLTQKESKKNNGGLSDEELIKKYEKGKVDMNEQTKKMIQPNPTAVKSEKQKSKVR